MNIHISSVLRRVTDTVLKSLPADVRRVVAGVKIGHADLGYQSGRKVLGAAHSSGEVILLDSQFVAQNAIATEVEIENTLGHELAHCYRARRHEDDDDDVREEVETRRLVRSWGFRQKR